MKPYSHKKLQINIPDFVVQGISSEAIEFFHHMKEVLLHSIKLYLYLLY